MTLKVHLQYPWKFPDSSYYKNILDFHPTGVEFINYKDKGKKMEVIGSSKKFEAIRKFKNILRRILNLLCLPNLTYSFKNNYDLIHCAHCLSLNKRSWVVDTETYDRVSAGGNIANSKLGKWLIKKRLESKYCKKIVCWSEDCKATFENAFPHNKIILDKITILPFALQMPKFNKIKHKKIRILFVARWFDAKGGRQTLEVFDRLSRLYHNAEFIFICPTPKEFKDKYSKNRSIKIMELIPQERLFREVYPSCDIFFYPGFGDSYGFAVPEALSYGLPVISTSTFAKRELVKEGKTGFLVDLPNNWKGYEDMNEEFIKDLVEKTSILITNKQLRDKMIKAAISDSKGRFSINKRNKKLKEIYEESV